MHDGRESRLYARYFLTLCVRDRIPVLTRPGAVDAIRAELGKLAADGDITPLEWVVMPDHVHLLFALGARLSLGRVMARFKTKTRAALAAHGAEWQRDYYEHRVRPDEPAESYALYIFLNPYRARLISADTAWPHRAHGPVRWEFRENLRPGDLPHPAWFTKAEKPAGW